MDGWVYIFAARIAARGCVFVFNKSFAQQLSRQWTDGRLVKICHCSLGEIKQQTRGAKPTQHRESYVRDKL
jgi:hypothetical protein